MLATFAHEQFPLEELIDQKREPVTVCIPAREAAVSVAATLERLEPLRERGLVDQLLVIDADSGDGTAELARSAGAEVHSENELLPELGPARGKGDAMWRGLSVAEGELVVFVDADIADLDRHYVTGLLGPLIAGSEPCSLVKGFYERPFSAGGAVLPGQGGRVTELTAKPLLSLLVPELREFRQPLAGEVAGRRELLEQIPFLTSYAVEIAMLIEAWALVGIGRMAQVDLGNKLNAHQDLAELGPMAGEVLEGAALTLARLGLASTGSIEAAPGHEPRLVSRPPLRELKPAASGG